MNIVVGTSLCIIAALAFVIICANEAATVWRQMGRNRQSVAAVCFLAVVCMLHAQKNMPTITVDSLMTDEGCYATNDLFHVELSKAPGYAVVDFSTSPVLVYARERASTNVADWVELLPRRLFGELPADYAIENATNFNYMVYLNYIPPSPVHTNGVFKLHGFTIDGFSGERSAGFINSTPITLEAE